MRFLSRVTSGGVRISRTHRCRSSDVNAISAQATNLPEKNSPLFHVNATYPSQVDKKDPFLRINGNGRIDSTSAKSAAVFLDSRASYQSGAMADFVNDYRELSRLAMWDELLPPAGEDFRVLDVCSGTGRFTQAFYELVLKPQHIKVTHDYTDLCSHSLDILRDRMVGMGESPNKVFPGDCRKLPSLIDKQYDLVVNMHGLYGIPKEDLSVTLESMYEAMAPGGRMVLSIGTTDSLYQRVPLFLYRAGLLKSPYTNNKDIQKHITSLGLEGTSERIVYYEEFDADDLEGLQRFVMDECGGNTFSVSDACAHGLDSDSSWKAVEPLIKLYFDPRARKYRFKQEVEVFMIEKAKVVLPDILSDAAFYADSYTLRRHASTMQSSMIDWLKTQSTDKIVSCLPAGCGRDLQILSVGCGDGELDLALLEGCKASIGDGCKFTGVQFLGLEPNEEFYGTFAANLEEGQSAGRLPPGVSTALRHETFPGNFAIRQGARQPDLVIMGHVLYYFGGVEEKVNALRRALQLVDTQGRVIVIHQAAQGVPELQRSLLPVLRGSTKDMFTADDIENCLNRELKDDITGFVRYDIEAFLDIAEVLSGSPKGIKIMSFCLETDHRTASDADLKRSIAAFQRRSQKTAEPARGDGAFMAEPVACFVIEPRQ